MSVFPIRHLAFTNYSSLEDRELIFICEAIRKELPKFCSAWGIPPVTCDFYSRDTELSSKEAIYISAVNDDGSADSLGYHTFLAGVPLTMFEAVGGARVASHEAFEVLANPLLSRWEINPADRLGYWVEACDAVQGDTYDVKVKMFGETRSVAVSNWLTPAWFGLPTKAEGLDRMGLCTKPFEVRPGGYVVTKDKTGAIAQTGAAHNSRRARALMAGNVSKLRMAAR